MSFVIYSGKTEHVNRITGFSLEAAPKGVLNTVTGCGRRFIAYDAGLVATRLIC